MVAEGGALGRELSGYYAESYACTQGEGGPWFGGDFWHCFRKADGSALRVWNTGCGWELGRQETVMDGRRLWTRFAVTYIGQCAAIPPDQLDTRALDAERFWDEFNEAVADMRWTYCPGEVPACRPGVALTYGGDVLRPDMAGHYAPADDCTQEEGGASFGGDFSQCFRKDDGSDWRLWNSGCGWEVGYRVRPRP
ncbi:MAG: hypothetical protein R3F60_18725 [bacterium]